VGAYLIQAMRADGRTDMINLMGAFRDLLYANAPKKKRVIISDSKNRALLILGYLNCLIFNIIPSNIHHGTSVIQQYTMMNV